MVDLSYRLQDFGLQPHHSGQCARRAPLTLLQGVGADLEDLTRGGPEQAHPLNPPAPGMFQPLAVSVMPSREKVTLRVGTRGAGCLSDVASSWISSLLALMLRSRAEVSTVVVSSCLRKTKFMFSKLTESRGEVETIFSTRRSGRGLSRHQVGRGGEGRAGDGEELTRLGWLQMFRSWDITVQTAERSPFFSSSCVSGLARKSSYIFLCRLLRPTKVGI